MQKKIIWLLLFCCVGVQFHLFAQDDKKKAEFESFKKKRIVFITKAMNLNDDEAKAFWTLNNELQEKKFNLNQRVRNMVREFKKAEKEGKTHSQEEYMNLVKLIADVRVQEAKLEQEYIAKFAEVISAQKIFLYQEAERQFLKEMMTSKETPKP